MPDNRFARVVFEVTLICRGDPSIYHCLGRLNLSAGLSLWGIGHRKPLVKYIIPAEAESGSRSSSKKKGKKKGGDGLLSALLQIGLFIVTAETLRLIEQKTDNVVIQFANLIVCLALLGAFIAFS
ncbi:MAG: hypothetical protein HY521_15600 [Proteobacteria bacterium]|nr:hypothetical protein [Pseudomonadota bacterium]